MNHVIGSPYKKIGTTKNERCVFVMTKRKGVADKCDIKLTFIKNNHA